jgi:crotonobetainyl-CoA:carnitine CoA-transferase CaiB-like acyl-CoA transferase
MVHVLAGPTMPRQLAAQGADCLNIHPFGYSDALTLYLQSNAGTRQAYLDARVNSNRPKVYKLVQDADIFIENLRPDEANQQGLSATELAQYRPGIIYVTNKLIGLTGPWANWVGFDLSSAALAGVLTETGSPDRPLLPNDVHVIHDFITGYLGSLGAQAALIRRAKEGGSYRVSVSLAQTAMFMLSLGLIDKKMLLDMESLGDEHKPLEPNIVTGPTPLGEYTRLGSQVEMSKTPEYWTDPMIYPIGSCKPEWLPRG